VSGRRVSRGGLVAGLLAAAVLVGPAAAAAAADGAPEPAPLAPPPATLAQESGGDGFGPLGEVRDEYGNSVHAYKVRGLQRWGVTEGFEGISASLPLWVSDFTFSVSRYVVVAIVSLLRFTLQFELADILLIPVVSLVEVYQSFVDELGLIPVALMLCVFWFGLVAIRGRMGRGLGQIAMSFVLVVVLGALLAAPGRMLLGDEGLLGRARDLGSAVAMLAVQDPAIAWRTAECGRLAEAGQALPDGCELDGFSDRVANVDDPEVLGRILEVWLVDMFIRQPHQYLVYGQRIDCPVGVKVRNWNHTPAEEGGCQPSPCLERYNTIVATTPADAEALIRGTPLNNADPDSYMYDMMHPDRGGYYDPDDGCDDDEALALASYLTTGDWDRVTISILTLVALLVLAVFVIVGVVIPLAIGQIMLAILIVALVFILPIALIGGGSRQILWTWVGLVSGALFMIVVALFGLSLMLVTTDLLLQSTWHLFASMIMAALASMVFLVIQRTLLRGGVAGGRGVGAALARMGGGGGSAAGGDGWARPADAGIAAAVRGGTFSGAREDFATRQQIKRRARNEDIVRMQNPDISRHENWRQAEATRLFQSDSSQVRAWRRRRTLLNFGDAQGPSR
jgi:hypothetical protein